jgi:PAS domain S-box-containing protein
MPIVGVSTDELFQELEAIYRLSTDLVSVSSGDGRFRRCSESWRHALGYSPDELAGRRWLDFVHPEDQAKTIEAARILDSADIAEFVNRYRHKDGSWVSLSWRATSWSAGLTFAIARVVK